MKVTVTKTKNHKFVYIQKDLYLRDIRGKKGTVNPSGKDRTTVTVEKLGRMEDLMASLNMTEEEVLAWARDRAKRMTEEEKKNAEKISVDYYPNLLIEKDAKKVFGCGYLFLQQLCTELRFDNICRNIGNRHRYAYDLEAILRDQIYARILEPGSKESSYAYCSGLLEPPKYAQHDIYRALSVLAEEAESIQEEVYRNSLLLEERGGGILYYDCTNYYFEIEEADDLRKYGKGKDHKPNPIVQMGLFLDGHGFPVAFDLFPGNENEQPSMKPLEEKIIRNYDLKKFIVCTDAGLGSEANRRFNHVADRAFIVTQSLRKLKQEEQEYVFRPSGWKRLSDGKAVDMEQVLEDPAPYGNELFYKDMPHDGKRVPDQRMIVTFSPKYRQYQRKLRNGQVERAMKMIRENTRKKERGNPSDPARFVRKTSVTAEGDVAEKVILSLDQEAIDREAMYDGFYAVCTDLLDDPVQEILKVSEGRWEIEESFRIMKTDFRARPVYLSREERIRAHFLICFLALLVFRILEKKLADKYTVSQIISALKSMKLLSVEGVGYLPAYKRTDLTDALHDCFGFRTDYQITRKSAVRSIISQTKKPAPSTKLR